MKYYDRDDMDINSNWNNRDMSIGIGVLNSHNLHQYNKSSNLNEMNMGVENGDANSGHFYMNSANGSESKNQKSIDSTKKIYEIYPNRYLMEK